MTEELDQLQVGIIVVSHADYGSAMLRTAEFILGQQSDCCSISVDVAHEVSATVRRLTDAAQRLDKGAGVLILTDMFGGTPTNLALSLLGTHKVEVVTGVNLPMLLKVFTSRAQPLDALARIAGDAGAKGIVVAGSMLRNKAREKSEVHGDKSGR
ncbi:MAG: PTS sugar transporter subunit IIA [Desulfovibrio sp.]|nr:PTS sugar transporter subunit IIA [Desulfovibrio sp.]